MKQKQVVKKIFRYVFITFTAALYAVGIALFLNPNNLAPGGISGIAIILKKMFPGLPGVGMLILLINIPILAVGIKKFGIKFILSTMYSLIVSSVLIDILPIVFNVNGVTDNKMLASVIGGATFGLGMGLMFRLDTTTGGLDIIVKIIKQKKPHLKTGQIYFLLDVVILAASAMAFKDVEVALYAAIAIYVSTVVMDMKFPLRCMPHVRGPPFSKSPKVYSILFLYLYWDGQPSMGSAFPAATPFSAMSLRTSSSLILSCCP